MVGTIIKQGGKAAKKAAEKKSLKALKMDKASRMLRAKAQGYDVDNILTHGSNTGQIKEIKKGGAGNIFDGIFASYGEGSEQGGKHLTSFIIRKNKMMRSGDLDVDYDDAIKFIKKEFPDANDETIDDLYTAIAEDSYDFHGSGTNPLAEYGFDDAGEAAWEAQRLRGQLALRQGFDAVEMSDEFGTSVLIPSGSKAKNINAAFDPEKTDSSKLLASVGAGVVGGIAMQDQAQAAELPPGFTLDEPETGLPPGYTLDEPAQQAQQIPFPQKAVQTVRGLRGNRDYEPQVLDIASRIESGEISARQLTPGQVAEVQKVRAKQIPELAQTGFEHLSENLGFLQAATGLVTFDPDEFGQILRAADPDIGIVTTPDGERIAVNNKTGAAASLNKLGPSLMDALQVGATAAAFTPGTAGATLTGMTGKQVARFAAQEGATQAGIEAAQHGAGGTFDPEEVAMAAGLSAALPVTAGAVKGGVQKVANKLARNRYLVDEASGVPMPAFEAALKKRGLTFGNVIDDVDNLPVMFDQKGPDQVVDDIIRAKLKGGATDDALATLRLEGNKIVDDALGAEAIKQGFDPGDIPYVKAANTATKRQMGRMLAIRRRIAADKIKALEVRPSYVVGDNVMNRFMDIRQGANNLRSELDRIAKNEFVEMRLPGPGTAAALKNLKINVDDIASNYFSLLDDLKVTYNTSTIPPRLDFSNSIISEDTASQSMIKKVTRILSKPNEVDAAYAHNIKRELDGLIDFKKKAKDGLPESGRRFAKGIRASINDSIREVSPRYAAVNDMLSESIETMNDFNKAMGSKVEIFADNARDAIGQETRVLLTNYASRQEKRNALLALDKTAKKLGYSYDVDIKPLIQFADTLDTRFGSSATGSIHGVGEKVAKRMQMENTDIKGFIRERIGEKVMDKFKPDDEKAFNVMQQILRRVD